MKYTKKPKINSLENLAGHLNKNKEDINEQDIHDQLYKYMDFWFTENPVVILDDSYGITDLRLILEFMVMREQNKR
jgi:hypothetical protein